MLWRTTKLHYGFFVLLLVFDGICAPPPSPNREEHQDQQHQKKRTLEEGEQSEHEHHKKQRNEGRFEGKVVIVTGASSGIGRAAAIEFAKEGAHVVITGQNSQRLDATEHSIVGKGVPSKNVHKIICSMENAESAKRIVDETIKTFKRIDILINNAATVNMRGCTDSGSIKLLDYLYKVNLRSVVELTELARPHLIESKGNVVNVSSVASVAPSKVSRYYGSLKAALDLWTKAMAKILGEHGVRINCLNPGAIDTGVYEAYASGDKEMAQKIRESRQVWSKKGIALGRVGTADEMADVLMFLASPAARYITGTTLFADGGATAMGIEIE